MNCEAFMDFTYGESDIAMEAFHPIKGLQNIIIKLIGFFQRALNNFKKLRKITIPKDMATKWGIIGKKLGALPKPSTILQKDGDGKFKPNKAATDNFNQVLDEVCNSEVYKEFMSADRRSATTPKSEYIECDSAKIVNDMNSTIKLLTDLKVSLNKMENPSSELQAWYKAMIRRFTIKVNIYTKILSFRKPFKDPANDSNMKQLDYKGGKATVYV